jgi:hypothetical protein
VEKKPHMNRAVLAGLLLAAVGSAQGTPPKDSATDYPVRATLGKLTLAADYLVHSIPSPKGALFAKDFLVIEVAVFGPKLDPIQMRSEYFRLRINGSKDSYITQSPGTVAASMKYPDWEQRPGMTASGGIGNGEVVYGPRPTARFPDDPTVRRLPDPPQVPEPENRPAKEQPLPIEDQVQMLALPEGRSPPPLAGVIFFPFRGKTKSIKTLELLYDGPGGKAVLKLQ